MQNHWFADTYRKKKSDKSVAANLFVCQKRNYVPKNCKTDAEIMARSVKQEVNTVKNPNAAKKNLHFRFHLSLSALHLP